MTMMNNILIYQDESMSLELDELGKGMNANSKGVAFSGFNQSVKIKGDRIKYPDSYDGLQIYAQASDRVIVATKKPYDNNYFYEFSGNIGIFSFSGWEHLTELPETNGLVYFVCQMLSDEIGFGEDHQKNTGCINDFLWDKRGVDIGMKYAFLCPVCKSKNNERKLSPDQTIIFETLESLLDQLCLSSRSGLDILEFWNGSRRDISYQVGEKELFDVFLCHNSSDKDSIRDINSRLKKNGINTWLDEEQLRPGVPWQNELEAQIQSISTVVVAVGASGTGPWQDLEIRAFLGEFVKRGCPVIPLVLNDCKEIPKLPIFLSQFTWVDLRKAKPDPFKMLLWGITGVKQ